MERAQQDQYCSLKEEEPFPEQRHKDAHCGLQMEDWGGDEGSEGGWNEMVLVFSVSGAFIWTGA